MALSEQFLIYIVASGIGAILVVCRLLYKSKCKNFELCCLKVQRDPEQENHSDLVIDMARRLSHTEDKPEKVVRFENIYKNELPKKTKVQGVDVAASALEEGLGSASIS